MLLGVDTRDVAWARGLELATERCRSSDILCIESEEIFGKLHMLGITDPSEWIIMKDRNSCTWACLAAVRLTSRVHPENNNHFATAHGSAVAHSHEASAPLVPSIPFSRTYRVFCRWLSWTASYLYLPAGSTGMCLGTYGR